MLPTIIMLILHNIADPSTPIAHIQDYTSITLCSNSSLFEAALTIYLLILLGWGTILSVQVNAYISRLSSPQYNHLWRESVPVYRPQSSQMRTDTKADDYRERVATPDNSRRSSISMATVPSRRPLHEGRAKDKEREKDTERKETEETRESSVKKEHKKGSHLSHRSQSHSKTEGEHEMHREREMKCREKEEVEEEREGDVVRDSEEEKQAEKGQQHTDKDNNNTFSLASATAERPPSHPLPSTPSTQISASHATLAGQYTSPPSSMHLSSHHRKASSSSVIGEGANTPSLNGLSAKRDSVRHASMSQPLIGQERHVRRSSAMSQETANDAGFSVYDESRCVYLLCVCLVCVCACLFAVSF